MFVCATAAAPPPEGLALNLTVAVAVAVAEQPFGQVRAFGAGFVANKVSGLNGLLSLPLPLLLLVLIRHRRLTLLRPLFLFRWARIRGNPLVGINPPIGFGIALALALAGAWLLLLLWPLRATYTRSLTFHANQNADSAQNKRGA